MPVATRSTSSSSAGDSATPARVLGSITPRLFTPPLRELTPYTSYGFDVIDFARDVLGTPLDPWQEWLVIHLGELLDAAPALGLPRRPRFRRVLVLIARQNGKTFLCRVLSLYWLFVERVPLMLGMNSTRDYAKEQWSLVIEEAKGNEWLAKRLPRTRYQGVRATIGEECFTVEHRDDDDRVVARSRYRIAAANRKAGRSLTIHRIIADELREHHTFDAWNAAYRAMNAVRDGQLVAISNQGDDKSVVLDMLRDPAVRHLEGGEDTGIGLFEWSAPPGALPDDPVALAQANPDFNRRAIAGDALVLEGREAAAAGGETLTGWQTEVMCQRVALLDPAIEVALWEAGVVPRDAFPDLAEHRGRVALCLDVSLDALHATLCAAAVLDGVVYVDVVRAWDGPRTGAAVRAELPDLVRRVRPRSFGWFPLGPAAVVAADLQERKGATPGTRWPPRGVLLEQITEDTPAVCMAAPELLRAGELRHAGDPMLTAHATGAQKLHQGDRWRFTRRNSGPVDGAYALAGAAHLARTLPPPRAPLRSLPSRESHSQ